ncbi:hypothetical protein AA13595_3194 [Gluconacetobacter johannae DSM 13595]|nr:hypothetical protein AA13595_3194 [Gluconacetobacter johannae DSM 13595]
MLLSGLALAVPLRQAQAGSFVVVDVRAQSEVSEISRLYVDDQLVATFSLDADHPQQMARIEIPAERVNHSYVLCGEITLRLADGRTEIHEVNGAGLLHHPDGHTLDALGSRNFTEFYLSDPEDPTVVERHAGRSSVCATPSS